MEQSRVLPALCPGVELGEKALEVGLKETHAWRGSVCVCGMKP